MVALGQQVMGFKVTSSSLALPLLHEYSSSLPYSLHSWQSVLTPGLCCGQVTAERLAAMNPRLYNFQLGNFEYTDQELHLGQLKGAFFPFCLSSFALSACCPPCLTPFALSPLFPFLLTCTQTHARNLGACCCDALNSTLLETSAQQLWSFGCVVLTQCIACFAAASFRHQTLPCCPLPKNPILHHVTVQPLCFRRL